jgi:putative peptidoglycan lipid II flippase
VKLVRRVSEIGGLTLISRILGFVRDILMARFLGAGLASDAFLVAFKLPNFFRRLFAEGAFSAGFVPVYSKLLGKDITPESQKAAEAFAGNILGWFLPILFVFLIIMEIGMVPVMLGLTGGFDGESGKFNLVVELGRYTFPYLTLISLVSFYAGILNAHGRFAAAAFVPVLLNVSLISALIVAPDDSVDVARYLAVAVSISGILQLLWLMVSTKRAGIQIRLPRPKVNEDVKSFLKLAGPAAIGAGITQINLLVDLVLAARLLPEGSVSWLYFADRLNQLPIGLIGVAVGTVLLPSVSRLLSANDQKGATTEQNKALEFSMLLTLPAASALIFIAEPLIAVLFERGDFSNTATLASAAALTAYAFGLPAYVLNKVLIPGYYARGDSKTPVKFAVLALIVNVVLNLSLIGPLGHVGLAAATAIAAWVNVICLYAGLRYRGHFDIYGKTAKTILKCVMAAIIMGLLIQYLTAALTDQGLSAVIAMGITVGAGAMTYFVILWLVRGFRTNDIRSIMGR